MPKSRNTDRARNLRVNQTEAEGRLWGVLRDRRLGGWKWKRQVPRGSYIVDFYCAEARVIVELDGSQHYDPSALAYDERRTIILQSGGARVIRIPNDEIFLNLDGVCHTILIACGGDGEAADKAGELFGEAEGGGERPLTPPSPP